MDDNKKCYMNNDMRRLIGVFSLLIVCVSLLPVSSLAQTKRALVIGLGEHEDSAWNKINGDKDVPYVLEFLNNANYEQIVTLVNEQATKDSIVAAFRNLEQSCRPDDIVYVHYSGHGQQMRDVSDDEPDDLDECWIPYDAYRKPCEKDMGEKHLTDDEVNLLLNNIRDKIGENGKMLVVVDACHSGDATRGPGETARGVEEIFEAIKSYFNISSDTDDVNAERWITLSACESHQVNIEMKDPEVGKLTYALYSKITDNEVGDNESFFKKIRMFVNMNTSSRPQRPVMSGEDKDKYNITDILR